MLVSLASQFRLLRRHTDSRKYGEPSINCEFNLTLRKWMVTIGRVDRFYDSLDFGASILLCQCVVQRGVLLLLYHGMVIPLVAIIALLEHIYSTLVMYSSI